MHRPLSLTLLLPALVGVRCGSYYTDCGELQETEWRETFPVPWEELEASLSPDGTLSDEACADLCTAHAPNGQVTEVLVCRQADGTSSTSTVDTGVEDTAAPPTGTADPSLYCEYVERPQCIGGRDHAAIASPSTGTATDPVLAWLEGTSHAEAASVKAFVALARELADHGAPASLIDGCRTAACDEVAHARAIGALVERRGGTRPTLQFQPVPARGLRDLALENAVEGCVREVWAAMLAHWQATHARDPELRATMAPIARDEARHGDLARAIHAWAMTQLSDVEQQQVLAARAAAIATLGEQVARAPDDASELGLPTREQGVQLFAGLAAAVWDA
jgi:hypothetical protein